MALTDLQIKNLATRKKRYEIADGNGLYVRVMPTGAKSLIFRYLFEARPRRMTLGAYPGVSLALAREKHALAMQDVQRGIDPGREAQIAKAKRKAAPTFADLLDEYWDEELGKTPSGKERKRMVEKDCLGAWGRRKVADFTRRDAVLLLDRVRKRAPIGANRLQSVLVRMFNFASERGIIEHSPLVGMKRPEEKSRARVLSDDEIRLFWNALDPENTAIDIYRTSRLAIKLILLTGQRPGEVCGMSFGEIDRERFWNIPATRRKNSEPQRIPLCQMALDIIEQAKFYSGDSGHVFRSSYKPEQALSRQAVTRAISRHWREMGIKEAFTPHDLRRTLRTKLAELGIEDIVAERVLGHKLQGMLAVYNRHSYDTEKRQALIKWEARLQKILGIGEAVFDNKIISLDARRRA